MKEFRNTEVIPIKILSVQFGLRSPNLLLKKRSSSVISFISATFRFKGFAGTDYLEVDYHISSASQGDIYFIAIFC